MTKKSILDLGLERTDRVSQDHIESIIQGVSFWQPEGTTLTVAAVFLKNGAIVVGKSSCISIENYDTGIGQDVAFQDAKRQIWELEGYLLKQVLSCGETVALPEEATLA